MQMKNRKRRFFRNRLGISFGRRILWYMGRWIFRIPSVCLLVMILLGTIKKDWWGIEEY